MTNKMDLTKDNTIANLSTHRESGVRICNPRILGDNSPIIKSVFLCLSFFNQLTIEQVIFIMTVLFVGRNPVAPLRDIANSFNTVANTVRSMRDGFTNFRQGITA